MPKTHGLLNKFRSEYNSWSDMKKRCYNKNSIGWKDYGERGIKVCGRWRNNFKNFLEDMGKKPTTKHTIERINNDGDYKPDNCRWATKKEQNYNKRNSRLLTYKNETKCLAEWSEIIGVDIRTIWMRLNYGWSVEKIMSIGNRDGRANRKSFARKDNKMIEYNGETKALHEWAKITGIGRSTLMYRLSNGWGIEQALNTPPHFHNRIN